MKNLSWIGTTVTAVAAIVNPWLAGFGLIIIYLVVKEICQRDIKIAEIEANSTAKLDKNSKKHNKKNR